MLLHDGVPFRWAGPPRIVTGGKLVGGSKLLELMPFGKF